MTSAQQVATRITQQPKAAKAATTLVTAAQLKEAVRRQQETKVIKPRETGVW